MSVQRKVLISLGGNAILPGRGAGSIEDQIRVTRSSMEKVGDLVRAGVRVILTHGNGPIVGNILLRNERAKDRIPPMPLDVCGADSQGGIGYMIQQCLQNVLEERGLEVPVVTLVTQVLVDAGDPAFLHPAKPIGPFYTKRQAKTLTATKGWRLTEDSGRGMRRVVPSPRPLRIIEEKALVTLFDAGYVVVAAGGGGIPVIQTDQGRSGVEAVIDKDRTAILLAQAVGADTLVNITAVDRVSVNYGTPLQRDLDCIDLDEAQRYLDDGQFPPGSMGPKIESAIDFLRLGGREVVITSPPMLELALRGQSGTRILATADQAAR